MDTGSCCGKELPLILACSGGSNTGQLSNEVARALTVEGKAQMYCMAGLAGQVEPIIERIRTAEKVVVVDGCAVACVKKAIELAGITEFAYVDLTEAGIEKTGDLEVQPEETATARAALEAVL